MMWRDERQKFSWLGFCSLGEGVWIMVNGELYSEKAVLTISVLVTSEVESTGKKHISPKSHNKIMDQNEK